MAQQMSVFNFADLVERWSELNVESVTKPELGNFAIPRLADSIEQLRRELRLIYSVAGEASEARLTAAHKAYTDYLNTLYQISALKGADFVSQRSSLGDALIQRWDETREAWPYFAALSAVQSAVFSAPQEVVDKIRRIADNAEETVKSVTQEVLANAKTEADRIEANARRTAAGFSIVEAQNQFNEASTSLYHKSIGWGIAGATSFGFFIWFAFYLYSHPPAVFAGQAGTAPGTIPQAIYLTAIRITILTAIGAITTFCLRLFRAHLHMAEFNHHRRRVANSMAAFVEAVQGSEQRDQILGRLVDSVITFGDSGILQRDVEGISVPSVAIEAVTKNLTSRP